jgi:hypothetical protein
LIFRRGTDFPKWFSNNGDNGARYVSITARPSKISGAIVPTGVPVIVDTSGHLGTTTSSARFKEAIKPIANNQ